MKYHPAANLFPLMEGAEFERLADDIEANGLQAPILRHADGSIIDGRNRFRACEARHIEPRFHTYEGTDDGSSTSWFPPISSAGTSTIRSGPCWPPSWPRSGMVGIGARRKFAA